MSDDRNQVNSNSHRICVLEAQMKVLLFNLQAMFNELETIDAEEDDESANPRA